MDDNRVWKRHANQIRSIGQNVNPDIISSTYYPVDNTPVNTYPGKTDCSVDRGNPVVDFEIQSSQGSNEQQNIDKNVISEAMETVPDIPNSKSVEGEVQCALRRSTRLKRKPIRLDL